MPTAVMSMMVNDNYPTFGFQADRSESLPERREPRARLLEGLLDRLDFNRQRRGEAIESRFAKYSREKMTQRLAILGKFTFYGKQLDTGLFWDSIVNWYVDDFGQKPVGE
jgi:hypothetical protein